MSQTRRAIQSPSQLLAMKYESYYILRVKQIKRGYDFIMREGKEYLRRILFAVLIIFYYGALLVGDPFIANASPVLSALPVRPIRCV